MINDELNYLYFSTIIKLIAHRFNLIDHKQSLNFDIEILIFCKYVWNIIFEYFKYWVKHNFLKLNKLQLTNG